ncbi:EAL domain-containing protein [Amphritea pacifica]|uniref:EAL domain-containing protein n=1 Tax=Amphritea pacifica TaxID=2811233 RepID=A0ABS2W9C2_9GAMM|nr:EAL domain-containing protein [Amphritea pacifica]MBN0988200.1 EAL domain-containing protein [Amphritea pacifica]
MWRHTFPFTRIKTDRSFVAQLNSTPESQALIRAIIAIGEALQLDISAEGVENEQQARILTALGSGQVQGYYLGNPMPAEATQTLIEQQAAAPSESLI